MNSPELSLDMNLDSPSATDVLAEGEGGGSGGGGDEMMGCGENNASTGVGIIQHNNHYQQREGHTHCNDPTNNFSSFGSRGDNISGTNSSALDRANQYGGGGTINKIDCDKMTSMIEDWKEELSMMRVKNAILLDDLVKIGANV